MYLILFYLINDKIGKIPEYIVYDDGCHLKRFCQSRSEVSERAKIIKTKKFVVDKLHIQNHTDHDCKKNCHPNLFPDLKPINTVICEQINFWLGKYKYITKHMNFYRYNFFLFTLLSNYNKLKLNGQFSLVNLNLEKSCSLKRKFEEIDELSDYEE